MVERTLHLKGPLGKTLFLTLCIQVLLFGLGEIIIRQQPIQAYLNTPGLNTRHRHLERQWHRLETLSKTGVKINCIALGNSMVLNGFDPHIFKQSFLHNSGREMTCFNFGVDALTPVSAAALAQILIETYQPQLLIFGTDARDFAVVRESEETEVIIDTAWMKYRLGYLNLEGWLVDHSYLYRYRRSLADLLHLTPKRSDDPLTNQYGYEPLDTVLQVAIPPDPNDDSFHIQYYYRILKNYTVQPENREALMQILAQQSNGTTVVVIEMPVPDTYFNFFDNPTTDYHAFMGTLIDLTNDYQVLLVETTQQHLIPEDGWMDYSHVNRKGASLFSEWLGQQLGRAYFEGQLLGLKQ